MADEPASRRSLGSIIGEAGLNLVPVIGGALAVLWNAAQERDRDRVLQMAEAAQSAVGDDDMFVRRLEESEQLVDMLVAATEAARRTSLEAKRIAMGRVIAQAVIDDARIDDHAAMLAALADLEAPHVRLLTGAARLDLGQPDMPEPYRAGLVRHGLIAQRPPSTTERPGGLLFAGVTPFGIKLLDYIRAAKPEAAPPNSTPRLTIS